MRGRLIIQEESQMPAITFDGSVEAATLICRTIREVCPEMADDQAPACYTSDGKTCTDLVIWDADGDATVEVGQSVSISADAVQIIRT